MSGAPAIGRRARAALAAGLALAAGCSRDRPRASANGEVEPAAAAPAGMTAAADTGTVVAPGSGAAGASGPLGDANILALIDQASRTEVENAALAARQAPSEDVKAYAREVARDHAALQDESDRLARRLAVIPQLPLNDAGGLEADAARTTLGSVTGADFDRAYVAAEVDANARTLQMLERARTAAGNAELRALVSAAIPRVRAHLERAKAIQERVGVPDS